MATVIFSNMGDTDTEVLKYIWLGMPKVKVVEITADTYNSRQLVDEAIENEHDTLIMCGHGTGYGLMNPGFKGGTYLIDRNNYAKIKCNRVIGIWCHAKDFAENYGVKGFWSSMFISNHGEATANGCYKSTDQTITEQEILFCLRLNELVRNYVPMKTWVDTLRKAADYSIDVVKFNYDGLKYYKTAPTPRVTYYGSYGSYGGYGRNYWYDDDDDWETTSAKSSSVIKSESKRWGHDMSEPKANTSTSKAVSVEVVSTPKTYIWDGAKQSNDQKSVAGIKKTSFADAEVVDDGIKTRAVRKKKRTYVENDAVIDDYTGISLDEEYPSQIWGFED